MKKTTYGLMTLALLIFSAALRAQQADSKHAGGGFGLQAGIPLGSKTGAKGTGGADVRFDFHAGPGFITLSGGLVALAGISNQEAKPSMGFYSGAILFVKAGYKYFLDKRFFVMAEVGPTKYFLDHKVNARTVNNRGAGFVLSPSAGFQFKQLDLAVRYEIFSVPAGSISNISLRIGLDF